jgi:two-component system, NtrC family, sensor kinase
MKSKPSSETSTQAINRYRILIIDDDPGIRETYREILADRETDELLIRGTALFEKGTQPVRTDCCHYKLDLEARGEEGIAVVRESIRENQPIALIFIDMAISGMNGAETARHIWSIDDSIKIVFVTAFSEYTPDQIISEIGRDDVFYLRKPFNSDEIRQFAKALTKQWGLEREKETLSQNLQQTNKELEILNNNLNEQVKKQTATMVQSEKMISLGILTTGIARKITKPVDQIRKNLDEIVKLSESRSQAGTLATASINHIDKILEIVTDLGTLSSADDTEFKQRDLHQILDTALNVIHDKYIQQIRVVKKYSEIPLVRCIPQKLSQVFVNILLNSVQAISENGLIKVTTELQVKGKRVADTKIRIIIEDNGCGISEEALAKIFDPFYTTKSPGEGTGLGMSVTYDIIKQHRGEIRIQSRQSEGTTVIITLPQGSRN